MNKVLLEMTLHELVPVDVAAIAVDRAARGIPVPDAVASRLSAVVAEMVRESRARESFDGSPDAVQVTMILRGHQVVTRVSDHRMPALDEPVTSRVSWRLSRLGFVTRLRLSHEDDAGNASECAVQVSEDSRWLTLDADQSPDQDDRAGEDEVAALTLRELAPADIHALVRLVFRCYAYTHPDPCLYAPESLRRMVRAGTLSSHVAVTPDGEVVGHAAVVADKDIRLPEYGRLVVDPRYRGHGLAEQLGTLVLAAAAQRGTPGIWAECVANHLASQRALLAAGAVEVGLLVGASPDTMKMARFDNPLEGRMTLVPMHIVLRPEEGFSAMHVPAHLTQMYRETIGLLGLKREITTTSVGRATGRSRMHFHHNGHQGTGTIEIVAFGADTDRRISDEFSALSGDRLGVVYLDIPLADPFAPAAIARAEEHGFFWAEIMPSARTDGDVLRLQRLGRGPVDVVDVHPASPHGEAMRDFVLTEWSRVQPMP